LQRPETVRHPPARETFGVWRKQIFLTSLRGGRGLDGIIVDELLSVERPVDDNMGGVGDVEV
jgi:hypothetical protein